ncbi:hypothetical protein N7E02_13670 [Aliirhizobium terrae]|uniref:hypothetical protein n=1 Tax=Terrirhizobium terrae TaxID=2926709 RepID=UPI002576AB50|nr:hypothetical protein [Rhizobium sp. CC-CFT758]WJH41427.1 hypothetical protein N7E02_13670 [Rhizobium sp. CC-CFT758]
MSLENRIVIWPASRYAGDWIVVDIPARAACANMAMPEVPFFIEIKDLKPFSLYSGSGR